MTGSSVPSGCRAAVLAVALAWAGPAAGQTDRVLEFDFPGLRIGVAEYDEGPTGTTVFHFPDGVMAAADVRGGSPGTVNVPAVRLGYEAPMIDAVIFSGGSWYGLSAATGAANAIQRLEREKGHHDFIAGVLGAIIYDVGRRRFSRITPDDALGRAALKGARPNRFPLGARGAGRFAMQGVYYVEGDSADPYAAWPHSGQGGAFAESGPTKVAVFTVVNAMGAVVDRDGNVVRCHRNDPDVECPSIHEMIARTLAERTVPPQATGGPTANTTLTLVVTNQELSFADLQRLAVQVHTSMGRAIQPFATEADGDILYAVTTGEVDNPDLSSMDLGVLASEVAWDAVLATVPELPDPPRPLAVAPEPVALEGLAGDYAFPGGGVLSVAREGGALSARFSGNGGMYFDEARDYRLIPAAGGLFIVDAPAGDLIRFDREGGRVVGLTLDPGPWGQVAERTP